MLEQLKEEVCRANLQLVERGLVIQTWGNVSGIDRRRGLVVIKPSGVPYARMCPEHMVVVALDSARVVEGSLAPSSDTPTHLELYRAFNTIGGIVHSHSFFATAWAQAGKAIPCYGTTQADYWRGEIPCTRPLRASEIENDYEANTGKVIVETLAGRGPDHHPGVLVAGHGPFAWGKDCLHAVENAVVLDFVARLAGESLRLNPEMQPLAPMLVDKHFLRKHGPGAYYGQTK